MGVGKDLAGRCSLFEDSSTWTDWGKQ